jgi:Ni2+-binding GTPase involved in maturation of urease and hydrogenase
MNFQLIKGSFSRQEALELLTKLIEVKIKFHENKIMKHHDEEDVKMREKRIKELQQDLDKVRVLLSEKDQNWVLDSEIAIEPH